MVKIEPPEGDPCRTFLNVLGGDLPSNPVFELDNRGKRAIALDLSSERGLALAHQLVAEADVFLTNLRPSALERIGLGPDQVHERHPGLVYAIITGYGLEGPEADRGAYDVAAFWARAGIAESLRGAQRPASLPRGGMGDHSAAMTAAAMISAALVEQTRTGRGQVVSTSLLRQGCYTIGFDLNIMLMWGRTLGIGVRETMYSPVVNNYTAGDGRAFWIVGLEGDRHWPALARAVGHPEWLTDERFGTLAGRAINARVLIALLDEIFATRRSTNGQRPSKANPSSSGARSTRSKTWSPTSSSWRPSRWSMCLTSRAACPCWRRRSTSTASRHSPASGPHISASTHARSWPS